jgi:DNA-binding NtrC family response regulator
MKILVVDDEKMILDLTSRILARAGFEVVVAESGEQAARMFGEHASEIGLAIVDFTLGDLSGPEVLERLHAARPELPVIISSGHVIHPSDFAAQAQGNIRFLHKPYRANELVDAVRSALETNKADQ